MVNSVLIRRLSLSDVTEEYLGWLKCKETNKYLEVRHHAPKSIDDLAEWVKKEIVRSDTRLYAICEKYSNKHIGNIRISSICEYYKTAKVGILIGNNSFTGKGLGTAAMMSVLEVEYNMYNMRKISAGVYRCNRGSRRLFEKSGFSVEAILEREVVIEGREEDIFIYTRFKE